MATNARYLNTIGPELFEFNTVEASRNVRPKILRTADLVQQLRGDRADRDLTPSSVMLTDN